MQGALGVAEQHGGGGGPVGSQPGLEVEEGG